MKDIEENEEKKEKKKQFQIKCLSNCMVCWFKKGKYEKCMEFCSKILEMEGKHFKALYF